MAVISIAASWPATPCTSVRPAATWPGSAPQQLHRNGVAHNDLAKEANWLVTEDGRPALIDFQLAVIGNPRSRWMRLLAREDLRHLLAQAHVLPRVAHPGGEARAQAHLVGARTVFATGKPVYRFVTRRILHWEDNEGQGPKP